MNFWFRTLGPHCSRRTREFKDGYDGYQAAAAAAAPGVEFIQWCDVLLDAGQIEDEVHRKLLSGPKVETGGFEDFKAAVVRRATTPPPPPPVAKDSPGSFLFVDADEVDAARARRILAECRKNKMIAMMPVYGVDTLKDWRANYAQAGRVAVIHEQSDPNWLNKRLDMFARADLKRPTDKDCFIYLGPPAPKDQEQISVTHPRFHYIEAPDGDLQGLYDRLFK